MLTVSLVVANHRNKCVTYHVYCSRMRMLCEWNNAFLKVIRLFDARVTIVTTVTIETYAMFLNVHKSNLNYQTIIVWNFVHLWQKLKKLDAFCNDFLITPRIWVYMIWWHNCMRYLFMSLLIYALSGLCCEFLQANRSKWRTVVLNYEHLVLNYEHWPC